ncbi:MAG TPA: lysylphosphatidylglycerol synthase domain-containing protein, partial [Chitinophagaceae bacterium]|nr:lysylphosphatidylglycerol synthase domain-containing protein [Chitinophagaceae bacterium]
EKVPAHKLVGTIVAERAFDLLCLLIAFGATFILEFDAISAMTTAKILPALQGTDGHISYSKIVALAASAILLLLLLKLFFTRFGHINLVQKLKSLLQGIAHGIGSIRYIRHKGMFLFQTALIWVLYLLSTWLGFFALKETSHLDLGQACAVLVMGSVGMIVSPGGIGAYAYLIQQTVVFFAIPETPYGLALGWLLWFGQFVIFVVFGVISFILLPVVNKKKTYEESRLPDAKNLQAP